MTDPWRLLCVFAHPDDESMGMGGMLARYAAEGVETHLVCATRGERGWFGSGEQNSGLGLLAELHEEAGVAILAMQGTFYRAFSLVNGGRKLETDIFEGIGS